MCFFSILIGKNEIIKISDFGTSRQWSEHSTLMSFAGTVAWMAPEVIRNEPCNEKVDIWSFGVCVWELLTGELPYKNVDSSAIIWGVGSNSLQLPLPSTCPEGFKLLIKQCWSSKPRNRPSFRHILMHSDSFLFIQMHLDLSWQLDFTVTLIVTYSHGLRTPHEGTNLRYLKEWADVADKICCRHT